MKLSAATVIALVLVIGHLEWKVSHLEDEVAEAHDIAERAQQKAAEVEESALDESDLDDLKTAAEECDSRLTELEDR